MNTVSDISNPLARFVNADQIEKLFFGLLLAACEAYRGEDLEVETTVKGGLYLRPPRNKQYVFKNPVGDGDAEHVLSADVVGIILTLKTFQFMILRDQDNAVTYAHEMVNLREHYNTLPQNDEIFHLVEYFC
jgi:hypothetical protein